MKGRSLRSGDTSKRSKRSSNDIVAGRGETGRDTVNSSTNNVARSQKIKKAESSKTGRRTGGLLTMPRNNPPEERDCGSDGEEDVLVDSGHDNRKRRHDSSKDASSDEDSSSSEDVEDQDDDDEGNISDEAERAAVEKENILVIAATDGRGTRQRIVGTYMSDICAMACESCSHTESMY